MSSALTKKFGPFAGWAHNTLFIAELPGVRERVAEGERLAKKGRRGGAAEAEDGEGSGESESDSESESEGEGESEAEKPPAKKRNTAAARAAEAAATFNKIKQEEGGAVPRTPGGK